MKVIFKYISVALVSGALGLFTSCGNEFLDREPVSTLTPEAYFTTDAQLRAYITNLYDSYIEDHSSFGTGSTCMYGGKDAGASSSYYGSDDMLSTEAINERFIDGLWQVNTQSTSFWNFEAIYEINYFLKYALPNYEAGEISGTYVDHCIGEAYWLRAYFYYLKWRDLGDFPIIDETLADDYDTLTEASKRSPRNEVARFIMSDLDKAAELMNDTSPDGGAGNLLSKNVAYLLKSRVALFEATWLENFKGTAFVPGGTGWPGADKDYNSGFSYVAGSIDAEIEFFLGEAISSADKVASSVALTPNTGVTPQGLTDVNPYFDMFGQQDLSSYEEVLFWKAYDGITSWKTGHSMNYFVIRTGSASGFTRGLVMQFLDRKGLPWYASEDFTNDDDIFIARLGKNGVKGMDSSESLRDLRISLFLKNPEQLNIWINSDVTGYDKGQASEPIAPLLAHSTVDRDPTGYLSRKGANPDKLNNQNGVAFNGCVLFRASEAYLNYIEAYYMLYGSLGGNATTYWEALRTRAGIAAGTIQTTIDALDISKEAKYDWAAYTAGQLITDKTLFAIRKERRSEFIAENMRGDDLRRWRAMDQMVTTPFHPQGFKLWSGVNWDLFPDTGGSVATDITSKDMLIAYPASNALISMQNDLLDVYPDDGDYIYPYRNTSAITGYSGYTWKMAHYLVPLEIRDFTLTSTDGDLSTSPIYQNPYWPTTAGSTAQQ